MRALCLTILLGNILVAQTRLIPDVTVAPKADGTATGELRFRELLANGSNYVGFKAPSAITANKVWTLPGADGTASQCLTTNGSLLLSWADCAVGSSPPFADTTSIVKGSVDATKQIRFEVDGLTTATTRVLTVPDADITLMSTNTDQDVTGIKTIQTAIGADYYRVHKISNRAVFWQTELSVDGLAWRLKDSGPNIVLDIIASPTRYGLFMGGWHPSATATYDLGDPSYRWKDGRFSGTVYATLSGNASTATQLAADPTDCAGGQYATAINTYGNLTCSTPPGGLSGSGTTGRLARWSGASSLTDSVVAENVTTGEWTGVRNILPAATVTYILGSSTYRWSQTYTDSIYANTITNTSSPVVVSVGLSPNLDNTQALGTGTNRWSYIYGYTFYAYTSMYMNGTTWMDSSRNLSNIGTISTSGAITSGGGLTSTAAGIGGTGHNTYSGGTWYYGTNANLSCGTGEAIKSITVYGGVVTAVSCGIP